MFSDDSYGDLFGSEVPPKTSLQIIEPKKPGPPDFDWVKFPELSKDLQVEKLPSYLYQAQAGADFPTLECPSHKHTLIKNVDPRRVNWRCNRITGSKVCKSEIYSYNSKGVLGYVCK